MGGGGGHEGLLGSYKNGWNGGGRGGGEEEQKDWWGRAGVVTRTTDGMRNGLCTRGGRCSARYRKGLTH